MPESSNERDIWVVTGLEDIEGERGFGRRSDKTSQPVRVPFQQLRTRMQQFVSDMGELLADVHLKNPTGLELDEVELSVEIGGKGQIYLIGQAEGKGALTLKFKKQRPD